MQQFDIIVIVCICVALVVGDPIVIASIVLEALSLINA